MTNRGECFPKYVPLAEMENQLEKTDSDIIASLLRYNIEARKEKLRQGVEEYIKSHVTTDDKT